MNKFIGMIKLMRPKQWVKNSFVFAALIFSIKFTQVNDVMTTIFAAICFCMISSTVYVFNDIIDAEKDKNHPKKKFRPIAAGVVSKKEAYFLILILLPSSIILSYFLGLKFFAVIIAYIINNILYSYWIKHMVILDVMSIALGFILRVIGGAFVINVVISPWILLCTMLLSLFLGFSKRRHEILSLEEGAQKHRKILEDYSISFIDSMLSIITASIVMAYSMYTFNSHISSNAYAANSFNSHISLMVTIPFVLYGIFRYQYILYQKKEGGSPEETVISDKPLLINIVLWVVSSGLILYYSK